ncbi:unnamed protein product [Didymodactylos carnosus]|uniref:Bromo domain-containing protein n=1 Tax=Didymodactylos carnosus TaxID=1234261 RepID=A0A8S2JR10_9BILA|nr:unnamed protein product [Didymodactylos carnosus]CAF3819271.1 unnamed protein product [Didymodactylos carnosus]
MAFNDLKSQYILAFTILKHGGPENKWNKISDDIRQHVPASPVACLKQYNELLNLYETDWRKSRRLNEPFYKYLYSKLKKMYYGEICDKIQESRKMIDVVYEFLKHFGEGRIQIQDINDILKQIDFGSENGEMSNKKLTVFNQIKDYMSQSITDPIISNNHPVMSIPPFRDDNITEEPIKNSETSKFERKTLGIRSSESDSPPAMLQDNVCQKDQVLPNIEQQISSDINEENVLFDNNNNNNNNNINNSSNNSCSIFSVLQDVCQPPVITIVTEEKHNNPPEIHASVVVVSTIDNSKEEKSVTNQNQEEIISFSDVEHDDGEKEEKQSAQTMDTDDTISNMALDKTKANEAITFDEDRSKIMSEDTEKEDIVEQPEDKENDESNLSLTVSTTPTTQSPPESIQGNRSPQYEDISNESLDLIDNNHQEITAPSTSDDTTEKQLLEDNLSRSFDDNTSQQHSIDANEDSSVVTDDNPNDHVDANIFDTFSEDNENEYKQPKLKSPKSNVNRPDIKIKIINQKTVTIPTKVNKKSRKPMLYVQRSLANSKYGSDFKKPILSYNLPEDYTDKIKKPMDLHQIKQNIDAGYYDEKIYEFQRDVMIMFTNALYFYAPGDEVYIHALETLSLAQQLLHTTPNTLIPWGEEKLQPQKLVRSRSSTTPEIQIANESQNEFLTISAVSKQEPENMDEEELLSTIIETKLNSPTIAPRQPSRRTKRTNTAYFGDSNLRSKRKRTS